MDVQGDGFGIDVQIALVVGVGVAAVRFHGHVRLAAHVEFLFDHVRGGFEDGRGFFALDDFLGEIHVGRARVNFQGVVGHGRRGVHVRRQFFEFDLDLFGRGLGLSLGVGADDGQGVAVLEDFLIAEDGPVPAVAAVANGVDDQAVDAVVAAHVLVGQDAVDAGHLFRFRSVDGQDVWRGRPRPGPGPGAGFRPASSRPRRPRSRTSR